MMTADLDLAITYLVLKRKFNVEKYFGSPFLFKCNKQ